MMKGGGILASAAAPLFEDCYNIWMDFPTTPMMEHCHREANQVAHELARQAFVSKVFCMWVDLRPSFIFPILSNNVTMLSDE